MSLDNATKMAVILARKGVDDEMIDLVLSALNQQGAPKESATVKSASHSSSFASVATAATTGKPETPRLPFVEQRDPLALERTELRVNLMRSLSARPMTSTDLGVVMYGSASPRNTKRVVDVAYALKLHGLIKSDWYGGFAKHLYHITDKGRAWVARVDREMSGGA